VIPLTIDRQREPFKGDILLSEPFLMDNHFTRSVILVCEHNAEGSFGLILNSTLELSITDLIETFPKIEAPVGMGGPVEQNQLFFIHKYGELKDCELVTNGIYMGGDYDELQAAILKGAVKAEDIRFFVGYSGWGENQLKEELKERSWIVITPTEDTDFFTVDDDHLWKRLVQNLGGKYARMADYPINPADN
jgi:putative transcriptional regulator